MSLTVEKWGELENIHSTDYTTHVSYTKDTEFVCQQWMQTRTKVKNKKQIQKKNHLPQRKKYICLISNNIFM